MTQDNPAVRDVPTPDLLPAAFPADAFPQVIWEGDERPASLPA
ncbi:hypothetical protein [Deinococcus sp. GbtcB9]|nr:hypothetical protein [Deinococcus sp. GbtcB9]